MLVVDAGVAACGSLILFTQRGETCDVQEIPLFSVLVLREPRYVQHSETSSMPEQPSTAHEVSSSVTGAQRLSQRKQTKQQGLLCVTEVLWNDVSTAAVSELHSG